MGDVRTLAASAPERAVWRLIDDANEAGRSGSITAMVVKVLELEEQQLEDARLRRHGHIYKAVQKPLDRPVAIKQLKRSYRTDGQIVKRFERESRDAAVLYAAFFPSDDALGPGNEKCARGRDTRPRLFLPSLVRSPVEKKTAERPFALPPFGGSVRNVDHQGFFISFSWYQLRSSFFMIFPVAVRGSSGVKIKRRGIL